MPERVAKALERCKLAARIADDNRAKEILLLDLREATPLIDFFVIASANSRRQAYAIASEIDQEMKKLGEAKLGMEGAEEGRWILVDYGDFVIHVFSEDARTYYDLEEIWGDAPRVEWRDPARIKPAAAGPEAPTTPGSSPRADREPSPDLGAVPEVEARPRDTSGPGRPDRRGPPRPGRRHGRCRFDLGPSYRSNPVELGSTVETRSSTCRIDPIPAVLDGFVAVPSPVSPP